MKETVYIVGAGAIGKALAVCLALNGRNVVILRGSIDGEATHTETIKVVLHNQNELEAEIVVGTFSNFTVLDGIIALTNKSYGNPPIANMLKGKTGSSPIVVLQNGLGVEQVFIDHQFPEVYRCVLFATSQPVSQNTVSFKPVSASPIGVIQGSAVTTALLNSVVTVLNSPQFPFEAVAGIETFIWKKTIINSVFNTVCPLLEVDNGIFHREAAALGIAKRVIAECVAIAVEKGVLLDAAEVTESLLLISKFSDGQLISTLQDMRHGRKTELETLNFAISAIAKTLHKENMVIETALLGELTRLKVALNNHN